MASDGLIHYVCTSREHLSSADPGLTQHDGEWALCPQLLANEHDWSDTGGIPVREAVARWRGRMGVDEPHDSPAPAA